MHATLFTVGIAMFLLAGLPAVAAAQAVRGVVLDQTGLPLPGAIVEVHDGATVTATVTAGADGTFEIPAAVRGTTVVVRLDAFETVTLPRTDASRVVLPIARASTTTEVVASILPAGIAGGAAVRQHADGDRHRAASQPAPPGARVAAAAAVGHPRHRRPVAIERRPSERLADAARRLRCHRSGDRRDVDHAGLRGRAGRRGAARSDECDLRRSDGCAVQARNQARSGSSHRRAGVRAASAVSESGIREDRGHFSALRHGAGGRIRSRPLVRRRRVQLRAHRRAGSHAGQRAEHRREERQRVRACRHRAQQPASPDGTRPDLSQRHGFAGAQPAANRGSGAECQRRGHVRRPDDPQRVRPVDAADTPRRRPVPRLQAAAGTKRAVAAVAGRLA